MWRYQDRDRKHREKYPGAFLYYWLEWEKWSLSSNMRSKGVCVSMCLSTGWAMSRQIRSFIFYIAINMWHLRKYMSAPGTLWSPTVSYTHLGIDTSLFEAAEVDGATSSQVFWQITLPLLRPILVYVVITSLIGGLQLFDVPQILTNGTGDPMRSTMTLIMFLNKHLYSKNYGMAGALSVVLFIITGILSLVVFKITGNDKRKGWKVWMRTVI